MFAVLTMAKKPRGLLQRLGRAFRWGRLCPVKLAAGGEYWCAEVFSKKLDIPWEKLQNRVGETTPWLLPEDVVPPEGLPLFSLTSWREGELEALAVRILRRIQASARRKDTVLIDRDGRWLHLPQKLLPLCAAVKVSTRQKERYRELSDALMEQWGAGLMVSGWEEDPPSGALFLDPEGFRLEALPAGAPVLTALPKQRAAYAAQVLSGMEAMPFGPWEEAVPDGIDLTDFWVACRETPEWAGREKAFSLRLYCAGQPVSEAKLLEYCGRK